MLANLGQGWHRRAILSFIHRRLKSTLRIGLLICSGGALAAGQPDVRNPPPRAVSPNASPAALLAAGTLLQRRVVNSAGTPVARIEDLVLDLDGRTRYTVLSYGKLRDRSEYILVPWQVLSFSSDAPTTVTLDMTDQELKRAPRIDPAPQQHDWNRLTIDWGEVDRFYLQMFRARGASLPALNNQFKLLDRNNNCYLAPREAALLPGLEEEFSRADTNHDQRLSQGEFIRFKSRERVQTSAR